MFKCKRNSHRELKTAANLHIMKHKRYSSYNINVCVYLRGRNSRQRKQAAQFISFSCASVCCCLVAVGVYKMDLYSLSLTDTLIRWDHCVLIDVARALSVRTHPIAQKSLILYRFRVQKHFYVDLCCI